MILEIEKIENGKLLKQANQLIVSAYNDLMKRNDIRSPHRKVTITIDLYDDLDTGKCVLDARAKAKLPDLLPEYRYRAKGEIKKNGNQLEMFVEKEPLRAAK